MRRWTFLLAAVAAAAQEAAPFAAPPEDTWKPAWELMLRGDRLSDPSPDSDGFQRAQAQLRLRWSLGQDPLRFVVGTRSAIGSDGNSLNPVRWDQQPSNGTQLDVAHGDVSWASERAFGTLSLGFQENGLLVSQALWDRDLRFLGVGGRMGVRSEEGLVQEAGMRIAAGRVRNLLGGRGDLAAGQVVLKLDTGPFSWSAHAGRWRLSWDSGGKRLHSLPAFDPKARQRLTMDAAGASWTWNSIFPLEGRWFTSRNRATGETSEEVQATAGSRERVYWPQLSFTWQRLSSTGTLYPVNGDDWWFYRRAKGPRFDLALPLQGRWIAALTYVRQRSDGDAYQVTRQMLTLTKRF